MSCSNCGRSLPPGATTCPNCGASTPYNAAPSATPPPSSNPNNQYGGQGFQNPQQPNSSPQYPAYPSPSYPPANPAQQSWNEGAGSAPNRPSQPGGGTPSYPAYSPANPAQQSWNEGASPAANPASQPGSDTPAYPAYPYPSSPQQQPPYSQPGSGMVSPPQQPLYGQPGSGFSSPPQQPLYGQPGPGMSSPQQQPLYGQPGSGFSSPPQQPLYGQPVKRRRGLSGAMTAVIIVVVLLLLGGSALVYYATIYHPAQLHAQATGTAQAYLNATALANTHATGTAQAYVTATAQAQATVTAQAQATTNALQSIYTTAISGTPALNDSLAQNSASSWSTRSDATGSCFFAGGALHAKDVGLCIASSTNFSNFAFQVKETNIKVGGIHGLLFRVNPVQQKAYLFSIDNTGGYELAAFKPGQNNVQTLSTGSNTVIKTGVGDSNLIAVVVRGNTIYMFVNQQYLAQVDDSISSSGSIGVFSSTNGSPEEAAFNNAQVWRL